ncbi:MAG: stage III sporulation protein AA [Agathobacter sp.]|nr:stage III sporulation protein AA [Agathobacter sp.]
MEKGLVTIFPKRIRSRMQKINWNGLEEIRVRIGWPVELIYSNHNEWLGNYECKIDRQCLDEMLNYITGYSMYAMEEEIKQGYITLTGGHRIGITGHATYEALRDSRETKITNIVDIGGLNIRIAHERIGCAKDIIPYLRKEDSIYNTFVFAAPGIGKTTYLRDMIRILSSGEASADRKCRNSSRGMKICVIDERSEIAACIGGKPQNDLGKRTDILDACPKEIGMRMVLRTMSPEIIAVDEIGKKEEFRLLEQMRCSGVKILGTLHAGNIEEVLHNPMIQAGIRTGAIERFVELVRLLDGQRDYFIYDEKGERIENHRDAFVFRGNCRSFAQLDA